MKNKLMTGLFISAITLGGLTFSQTNAHADEWIANTPDQIQVTKDQKEYTLKKGDTLWAIGQKINVKPEVLAEINGIDLAKGEEKNLPVGRVISFDGNKVTVKEKDGSVVNESVIKNQDKVDPKKPVGEAVDNKGLEQSNSEGQNNDTQNPVTSGNDNVGNDESAPLITPEAPATPTDVEAPADNGTVASETPNQPATPVEAPAPAQPAENVPATPVQPAPQAQPVQPTTQPATQNEPHDETPEELHARMEADGWIHAPFDLNSSELVDWLFDNGYDGYDVMFGYIRPY